MVCRISGILWMALSSAVAEGLPRSPKDKPNIVMLFVDDLGYGDVGFTGHPTTHTPNLDRLAAGGKVLTTWYSGCPVCSGSRAALMTGRQFTRTGVPGVFSPTVNVGLPLNETTVAEQLKQANYKTCIVGKWHLGQREVYLPGNRGFDQYLGIPYSDDMGKARASSCGSEPVKVTDVAGNKSMWNRESYEDHNYLLKYDRPAKDPAGDFLPLVQQKDGKTKVLEQPLDLTTLAEKYNKFATDFIHESKDEPFFLYMPFSHVHTTAGNQPDKQYAGCAFKNSTRRGPFGDALAETDWLVGNVMKAIRDAGVEENTLIFMTGDNGPWMIQGLSAGSPGIHYGRYSGYWNTGKGSAWEGGVREAAFAYWKGQIDPLSRSAEVVSSMDVFPTVSALAGVPLPANKTYDGRDMSDVILKNGQSKHDFLFMYGGCSHKYGEFKGPAMVRHGKWKAHFCTGPGLGSCSGCKNIKYDTPLLFNIDADPSESLPLNPDGKTSDPEAIEALKRIQAAHAKELETFTWGELVPEPDGPGEGPDAYGVCCDRAQNCDCNGPPSHDSKDIVV